MTSSASALLLAAAVAAAGMAQSAPPDAAPGGIVASAAQASPATPVVVPVSAALAGRVAEQIAALWQVAPADVRLAWGRRLDGAALADDAPIRLAGRALDGWFVVTFEAPHGVPVALRVRAGVADTVAVAAHALRSGAVLAAGDVRWDAGITWGPPHGAAEPAPGEGWEVRRALAAGDALVSPAVIAPPLVASGAPLTLVWSRGGVNVTARGVALNSAAAGGTVRVRVDGRSDRMVGTAIAPAVVSLSGGTD